ncbi:ABC transporter substrate-binding protein [Iodobacter ciconiae]|uniref:Sugar ABC transporter substrate-binding protein n=1 Tax=Iodobacter ciconiae TaxID=2496266 RepID=A0A3S8ZW87_9NEIS|nr:ABC transporter substrate-binding protein [Iodobacter ciconiae]AZN37741.1 sugar ABC transporter substrate-binding protein [Iodobacter ciconiae]
MNLLRHFFILILLLSSSSSWAISVLFINPGKESEAFWVNVSQSMAAAAQNLGMELRVVYAERDHLRMPSLLQQTLDQGPKPDYLIVVNERQMAPPLLAIAERAQIPTLLTLNDLTPEQIKQFGAPRTHFKYWLGSVFPDNQQAGYLTAKALLTRLVQTKKPGANGLYQLLAIAGDKSTPASQDRVLGLQRALKEFPNVELKQIVYGNWRRGLAAEQMNVLHDRYPDVAAVWCANDLMAFGVISSLEQRRGPRKEVFVSAINYSNDAISMIKNGRLTALSAGHFMVGAWSIVLLYDYAHGRDFGRQQGTQMQLPLLSLVSVSKAGLFAERLSPEGVQKINFTRYSKVLNPKIKQYDFSLESLLQ